ncbi:MAG: hypothetical protein QM775_04205 [Pirellulales bacterium]
MERRAALRMHKPTVMEERLAAEHHIAARRADGWGIAAEVVGVLKREAARRQAVERRRADRRIAERGNRVGPLIVGMEKQNVRLRRFNGRMMP